MTRQRHIVLRGLTLQRQSVGRFRAAANRNCMACPRQLQTGSSSQKTQRREGAEGRVSPYAHLPPAQGVKKGTSQLHPCRAHTKQGAGQKKTNPEYQTLPKKKRAHKKGDSKKQPLCSISPPLSLSLSFLLMLLRSLPLCSPPTPHSPLPLLAHRLSLLPSFFSSLPRLPLPPSLSRLPKPTVKGIITCPSTVR